MPIGIALKAYGEETGKITGKKLRVVSPEEVTKFNDDLVNIAAQYGMDSIRSAIEEYQEEVFTVVRQVMQEANAPYGGAGALGDEVCMRALRPVDLDGMLQVDEATHNTNDDIWDVDYTTIDPTTATEREKKCVNKKFGETEGCLIFGALNENGSNRVINAYRWAKNQKSYPALTLPFPYCDTDRAQFVKFQAPIAVFTEETVDMWWSIVRASFAYVALVGIYATRASQINDTYSTGD